MHEELELSRLDEYMTQISTRDPSLSRISIQYEQLTDTMVNNLLRTIEHYQEVAIRIHSLNLEYNQLTTISNCYLLPNLMRLELAGNELWDIHEFTTVRLPWLTSLNISFNQFHEIPDLSAFTNLQTFKFKGNKIEKPHVLHFPRSLSSLNLEHCGITDLSFLQQVPWLRELYIGYNDLKDLTTLPRFSSLKILGLQGCSLTSSFNLDGFETIESLTLSHNKITMMPKLYTFKLLKNLRLQNCSLKDCLDLREFITLKELDLSSNKISMLHNLSELKCLEYLNISDNNFTVPPDTRMLKKLKYLNIAGNQLVIPPTVQGLNNLVWLDIKNNNLSTLSKAYFKESTIHLHDCYIHTDGNHDLYKLTRYLFSSPKKEISWHFEPILRNYNLHKYCMAVATTPLSMLPLDITMSIMFDYLADDFPLNTEAIAQSVHKVTCSVEYFKCVFNNKPDPTYMRALDEYERKKITPYYNTYRDPKRAFKEFMQKDTVYNKHVKNMRACLGYW